MDGYGSYDGFDRPIWMLPSAKESEAPHCSNLQEQTSYPRPLPHHSQGAIGKPIMIMKKTLFIILALPFLAFARAPAPHHRKSPTPTPTPRHSPSPTATATATAAPTDKSPTPTATTTPVAKPSPTQPGSPPPATATPTAAVASARLSATGIIGGGSAAWTNAHCNGRYKKYYWIDIQPDSATSYNWSDIDSQVASATANKKKFVLLLQLNSGDPSKGLDGLPKWLTDAGAVPYPILNSNHDTSTYQYFSWDPVFQSNALTFIAALCDRYDGQIAQISMGGLGTTTEMHMPDTFPYPDGKDIAAASAAWVTACNKIIAQYAAHLHKSTFTAALALPFASPYGADSLNAVVNQSLTLYGSAIGFENWGLKVGSSQSYLPNAIIYNHSATNPVGFQMAGSTGGGGAPLGGTLREAMEAGVALKAQYLQVYGSDIVIDTLWPDLDAVTGELAPAPSQ